MLVITPRISMHRLQPACNDVRYIHEQAVCWPASNGLQRRCNASMIPNSSNSKPESLSTVSIPWPLEVSAGVAAPPNPSTRSAPLRHPCTCPSSSLRHRVPCAYACSISKQGHQRGVTCADITWHLHGHVAHARHHHSRHCQAGHAHAHAGHHGHHAGRHWHANGRHGHAAGYAWRDAWRPALRAYHIPGRRTAAAAHRAASAAPCNGPRHALHTAHASGPCLTQVQAALSETCTRPCEACIAVGCHRAADHCVPPRCKVACALPSSRTRLRTTY